MQCAALQPSGQEGEAAAVRHGFTTGSCAAAAAAYRLGLVESRVNVNQPGGMIQIDIKEDGTLYMTGTVGYIADMTIAEGFFS